MSYLGLLLLSRELNDEGETSAAGLRREEGWEDGVVGEHWKGGGIRRYGRELYCGPGFWVS